MSGDFQFRSFPLGIIDVIFDGPKDVKYDEPFSEDLVRAVYDFFVIGCKVRPHIVRSIRGLLAYLVAHPRLSKKDVNYLLDVNYRLPWNVRDQIDKILRMMGTMVYQARNRCVFLMDHGIDSRFVGSGGTHTSITEDINGVMLFVDSKERTTSGSVRDISYNTLLSLLSPYSLEEFLHWSYTNNRWTELCDTLEEHALHHWNNKSNVVEKFGWCKVNNRDDFSTLRMLVDNDLGGIVDYDSLEDVPCQPSSSNVVPQEHREPVPISEARAVPECVICTERGVCILIEPCMCICLCEECSAKMGVNPKCPTCRKDVTTMKKVYHP